MSQDCYLLLIILVSQVLATTNAAEVHCHSTRVVDQSGNGQFKSIQSAIDSVPSGNQKWFCIHVTSGIYRYIKKKKIKLIKILLQILFFLLILILFEQGKS